MSYSDMDKLYQPQTIEPKWLDFWLGQHFGHTEPEPGKPAFSIVIPPPNVTSKLHLGHALNDTIQDILIRYYRMRGVSAEWMPGTDHAGIATQNVVERKIASERGQTRQDLGREAFLDEVWKYKDEQGGTIIEQLKRIGCSCDWDRERFTMDEGLSKAVAEVFVRLYDKGLIYRGEYIINWCPRCQTALSDEEAEHEDTNGHLWHLRYPAADGGNGLVVATTRPETMLGDVAVAVHPEDERYRSLVGKMLVLPLLGREIPVVADAFVDPAFGTGAVKVTPAHDPNDFEIGRRQNLTPIRVMNGDGTMNSAAGSDFEGLTREAARKRVVEMLTERGLLVAVEPHSHAVGHCYRCHTVTEPYLSHQWFVRMKDLAEPAIKAALDGRVTFHPDRWTKVYLNWMENIRDWCISRQLWWGHRIPVYYCRDCNAVMVSATPIAVCGTCGSTHVEQDPDVLDTWFSSWLWPFSTFGWPEDTKELKAFYPNNVLSTAPDIIFFWVARMIMAGIEFMGEVPFSQVYLHGIVRDDAGRKMSKSLGNGVDPLDVVETHGADALRFSMIVVTAQGQDIFISYARPGEKTAKDHNTFDIGRNFANKIWNATRLIFSLADGPLDAAEPPRELADRWIESAFQRTAGEMATFIEGFRFNDAARLMYEFIWHDFCDWYLEIIKPRVAAGGIQKAQVVRHAARILAGSMQLLHPIMPFITEDIWQRLTEFLDEKSSPSIMVSSWPVPDEAKRDAEAERSMAVLQAIISAIRTIRGDMNVPLGLKANVVIAPVDANTETLILGNEALMLDLAGLRSITMGRSGVRPPKSAAGIASGSEVFVLLEGLIDFDRERARLTKEIERRRQFVMSIERKLANPGFAEKAPVEVIQQERRKLDDTRHDMERLIANLDSLGA